MRLWLMAAALALALGACASHRPAAEIDAVVNDEAARQAARNMAAATANSDAALKAAADASNHETTPPK